MEKQISPLEPLPKWNSGWGARHTQALLLFLVLSAVYALRLNLSLAVVAMITSPYKKISLSSGEKALVLSSFFWGYGALQTFLGNLGRKRNPMKLYCWCLLTSAGLSLVTPFTALHYGAIGTIIIRVLIGLVQGGIYPNLYNLLAIWVVPQEKETVLFCVYNGATFGSFLALVSSGYLAAKFDWPSIFYVTGINGIIIGGLYLYYGKCTPDDHEGISKEEKEFMRNSFGENHDEAMKKLPVPWGKILSTPPMIALTITHFCSSWTNWTISTLTPTYMNGFLGFGVENDGFLSSLSSGVSCVLGVLFTFISTYLRKKNLISITFSRFLWNSIALYGSAFALIALSYTQDVELAIILITTANAVTIANNVGFMANHSDLSPNFSGVLYAFTNSIANMASIFGPLISTYMIKDASDLSEWKFVFLMAAVVSITGNTVFLFFGTTKLQKWNNIERKKPTA